MEIYCCQCCGIAANEYEFKDVYDVGLVCNDCLDKADDKTGYCSMSCQLGFGCDGSC